MSNWTINGKPVDALPVYDRAVQYGDGVFETLAIRRGAPRFWELHAERLANGCARLGIDVPDIARLRDELDGAIAQSGVDPVFAIAKIMVTAGVGPRGYRRPDKQSPNTIIGVFISRPWPVESYRNGVEVTMCQTRLACQPQLAGIKSLNRLEQVIAQSELTDAGISEGLMMDTDDRLICGTMSNVFLINQKAVLTPAITRCGVSGVMRRKVIEVIDDAGIDYEVCDIDAGELNQADGIFLSNSQFGVLPVVRCGDRSWPTDGLTRDIMTRVAAAGVPECSP